MGRSRRSQSQASKAGEIEAVPRKGESEASALTRVEMKHPNQKVVDPPRRGGNNPRANGSRKSTLMAPESGSGYYHDLARPYTTFIPNVERLIAAPSIAGSNGKRVYSTYPYSEHIFPKTIGIDVVWWDSLSWFFSTEGASTSSPAIRRIQNALKFQYTDVIQYVQDARFISATTLVDTQNFIQWLNFVSAFYCTLRALQGIVECPIMNAPMQRIKANILRQRVRLEALLNIIMNYPLPSTFYAMLDKLCGVCQVSGEGAVMISMVNSASPQTHPDLGDPTAFDTWLSAVENNFTASLIANPAPNVQPDFNIILDMMRLAYPTRDFGPKPMDTGYECYDMQRYSANFFGSVAPAAMGIAPQITDDRDGTIMLGTRGVQYTSQYMSLFRTVVCGKQASAGPPVTLAEGFGLLLPANGLTVSHGNAISFYSYDNSVFTFGGTAGTFATAILPDDPAVWKFKWGAAASFNLTETQQQTELRSLLENEDKYVFKLDDFSEDTIDIIQKGFATGVR